MSMTLARFQHALDAYGADLSRWPQSQRIAAERLMAFDPAAAAAFAQARALDALIARGMLESDTQVVIVGSSALAEAWRGALKANSVPATMLSTSETEDALLTGLRCILEKCLTTMGTKAHKAEPRRKRAMAVKSS